MVYPIDNFDIVKDNILRFDSDGEFYMVLVLKRRKDTKGKMVDGCKGIEDLAKFKDSFAKAKDLIIAAAENADSDDLKQYIQDTFWYVYVDGVYQVIDKSVKSSLANPENLAKWLKAVEGVSKWLVPVLK